MVGLERAFFLGELFFVSLTEGQEELNLLLGIDRPLNSVCQDLGKVAPFFSALVERLKANESLLPFWLKLEERSPALDRFVFLCGLFIANRELSVDRAL